MAWLSIPPTTPCTHVIHTARHKRRRASPRRNSDTARGGGVQTHTHTHTPNGARGAAADARLRLAITTWRGAGSRRTEAQRASRNRKSGRHPVEAKAVGGGASKDTGPHWPVVGATQSPTAVRRNTQEGEGTACGADGSCPPRAPRRPNTRRASRALSLPARARVAAAR